VCIRAGANVQCLLPSVPDSERRGCGTEGLARRWRGVRARSTHPHARPDGHRSARAYVNDMPLIGISHCRKLEDYRQSVLHVGGDVRVLETTADFSGALSGLDGLLLTGGG